MTDREKLEAVAAKFQELMALEQQKHKTQAEMLRWCLQALRREPSTFWDFKRDQDNRRKIKLDKAHAWDCLDWLIVALAEDRCDHPLPARPVR